ncbi:MAG TPA: LytTR family DNA-binding domain-containing protein [Steroidobacteraceae bacterium]|jgi:two-component system LytT family response regulator|nr:LytTR family DNA-binding domain-containing protein [Steroidobacteraceae bacterium]
MDVMIVDDERVARQTVRECCEAEPDLAVIGEYANAAAALAAIRRRPPHLLFLDVQLGATSGIDLARVLAPPALPLIVFVTAYDHYAREAFEVSAVDYLVKPFDEQRFRAMLIRVRQRYTAQSVSERESILITLIAQLERASRTLKEARPRLLAEGDGHRHMIDVAQIEMLEADRNYVTLRVDNKTFHARTTLQQAAEAMSSQPMLRISRSCIVNINHVCEVTRTLRGDFVLLLRSGTSASSSQGYRDKVRAHLEHLTLGRT